MQKVEAGTNLFQTLHDHLASTGSPRDAILAAGIGIILKVRGVDLTYNPYLSIGSKKLLHRFPYREKKILRDNGVVFYIITGTTINDQIKERKCIGLPSVYGVLEGGDSDDGARKTLLNLYSRKIEIGVFPNPQEFFSPDSFCKSIKGLESVAEDDIKGLTIRYGLRKNRVAIYIAENPSTLTELIFQHQRATGQFLFGSDYAEAQTKKQWVYGATKCPTNLEGTMFASVGAAHPDHGLDIDEWPGNEGSRYVGLPRLLVPTSTSWFRQVVSSLIK